MCPGFGGGQHRENADHVPATKLNKSADYPLPITILVHGEVLVSVISSCKGHTCHNPSITLSQ